MTSDVHGLISALEAEYDFDAGFLGLLRGGHFDTRARDRFLRLLESIDLGSSDVVNRRLISLLWYLPEFLRWQSDRLGDEEIGQLHDTLNQVMSQLERILGIP